jgi:putative addiction module component (TIGR02574 family)
MNLTTEQLLNAALALPTEERLEIAEALFVSLQPSDQPPFDETWRDIVRRRSPELHSGQVAAIPWSEVKRRSTEIRVLQ